MDFPTSNTARLNAIQGPGLVPQVLLGFTVTVILYSAFMFIEIIYKYIKRLGMNRTELLPITYNAEDKSITIPQDPNVSGSKPTYFSENERSGIEFSYSFYLNINPSTFRNEKGLLHVFHKGYTTQFPLLAPGVYVHSDTNTLRIYMNTYKTWNNYVDVENFPVGKWVHVVLAVTNDAMEVYINGNLAKKLSFDGFVPYQNFEDYCCFSQRRITISHSKVPSVDETGMDIFGSFKGMLSKLYYFNYALCYGEVNKLMNEGPSSKINSGATTTNVPPYLDDTWWSQGY
jgi:hypothetical protein